MIEEPTAVHAPDGAVLAVVAGGEGPPLLLIPGLGASRHVFDPFAPALRRQHHVITFDPRGIGDSERGSLPVAMATLAADAAAVIAGTAGGAVDVLGASMGGVVAQQLAVDHPEVVRHLILAATQPPGTHAIPADPAARDALLGRGARTPEDAYRIACTVLYSPHFQRAHPEFIEEQVRVRAQHPVLGRLFRDQLSAMRESSALWGRLPGISAPTLVMHGTADAVSPYENAELLTRRIPGARLRPFDGSGHLFFHERPAESARVVDEFLT
ncbi:MAG: alpha/beta fold hydrolase [Candidatus Dormibacteria bacterium]